MEILLVTVLNLDATIIYVQGRTDGTLYSRKESAASRAKEISKKLNLGIKSIEVKSANSPLLSKELYGSKKGNVSVLYISEHRGADTGEKLMSLIGAHTKHLTSGKNSNTAFSLTPSRY